MRHRHHRLFRSFNNIRRINAKTNAYCFIDHLLYSSPACQVKMRSSKRCDGEERVRRERENYRVGGGKERGRRIEEEVGRRRKRSIFERGKERERVKRVLVIGFAWENLENLLKATKSVWRSFQLQSTLTLKSSTRVNLTRIFALSMLHSWRGGRG